MQSKRAGLLRFAIRNASYLRNWLFLLLLRYARHSCHVKEKHSSQRAAAESLGASRAKSAARPTAQRPRTRVLSHVAVSADHAGANEEKPAGRTGVGGRKLPSGNRASGRVGPSPEDGAEMAPEACRFLNLDGGPFPRVGSNNTRRAEVASYVRRRRRHSARRAAVAVKEGGGQSRKQAGQDLES